MGRRKIEIEPITNERNRSVTFLKRKNGLFKKAYELGVLCSVDVVVIIFEEKPGHAEKLYEYSSRKVKDILHKHGGFKGERDCRGPSDFGSKLDEDDDDDNVDLDADEDEEPVVKQPKKTQKPAAKAKTKNPTGKKASGASQRPKRKRSPTPSQSGSSSEHEPEPPMPPPHPQLPSAHSLAASRSRKAPDNASQSHGRMVEPVRHSQYSSFASYPGQHLHSQPNSYQRPHYDHYRPPSFNPPLSSHPQYTSYARASEGSSYGASGSYHPPGYSGAVRYQHQHPQQNHSNFNDLVSIFEVMSGSNMNIGAHAGETRAIEDVWPQPGGYSRSVHGYQAGAGSGHGSDWVEFLSNAPPGRQGPPSIPDAGLIGAFITPPSKSPVEKEDSGDDSEYTPVAGRRAQKRGGR